MNVVDKSIKEIEQKDRRAKKTKLKILKFGYKLSSEFDPDMLQGNGESEDDDESQETK